MERATDVLISSSVGKSVLHVCACGVDKGVGLEKGPGQ